MIVRPAQKLLRIILLDVGLVPPRFIFAKAGNTERALALAPKYPFGIGRRPGQAWAPVLKAFFSTLKTHLIPPKRNVSPKEPGKSFWEGSDVVHDHFGTHFLLGPIFFWDPCGLLGPIYDTKKIPGPKLLAPD